MSSWIIAFVLLLVWILVDKAMPYDSTDYPGTRSGLVIKTDALTGCQYLGTSYILPGGLTPRMDGTKHIGCRGGTAP